MNICNDVKLWKKMGVGFVPFFWGGGGAMEVNFLNITFLLCI